MSRGVLPTVGFLWRDSDVDVSGMHLERNHSSMASHKLDGEGHFSLFCVRQEKYHRVIQDF